MLTVMVWEELSGNSRTFNPLSILYSVIPSTEATFLSWPKEILLKINPTQISDKILVFMEV